MAIEKLAIASALQAMLAALVVRAHAPAVPAGAARDTPIPPDIITHVRAITLMRM
jgi:hypothetical protein